MIYQFLFSNIVNFNLENLFEDIGFVCLMTETSTGKIQNLIDFLKPIRF